MIRQFELVERVQSYDPDADEEMLNRAYVYGLKKHGTQLRASGDPYFSHPVEVAGILAEMKLDSSSIVTGLLHDTIEDTDATRDEIAGMFGDDIARLVDGVTKLSRLEVQSESTKEAENLRKLVLAMSSDIRVLLVKLADRLHNMRTLHHIKDPARRRRIARETMDLYAPLASRIGMEKVKRELEELAFAELNPDGRASVQARQGYLRERGERLVPEIEAELIKTLKDGGLVAQVSGREKTPYSIWRKMQTKNVSFEQLADIMAFRIIVADVAQCYQALGLLHGRYQVLPQRFKDYISVPKPNGYRSLHTGVIGPLGQRIEIQIRTEEMQDQADRGVAAHWIYKQGGPSTDAPQYAWLRSLIEILDKAPNAEEFLEHTKLEMFQDQVFCFTPKGKLIALPRGATPIDFAYAVHSQVGDTCVGSKINGRMLPLRTQLANGDQVEIITSKAQTPSPTWERFVVTGKAKAAIRRFIRTRQRQAGEHRRSRGRRRRGPGGRARGADGGLSGPQAAAQERRRRRRADLAGTQQGGKGGRRGPRQEGRWADRHPRPDPGHGGAFRALLPSAAGRPHRRHHHDRQGRHHPHHRLRHARELLRGAGALDRCRLGLGERGRGRRLYRAAEDHGVQPAGQPVEPVDGDRPPRGQYLEPAHRQPLDGFLRHGDRCRGGRRQAPGRHHRGVARHTRHQRRRTRSQLKNRSTSPILWGRWPEGPEGEGHSGDESDFRSEIFEMVDVAFPLPASPV